jgi:hypothetical protein
MEFPERPFREPPGASPSPLPFACIEAYPLVLVTKFAPPSATPILMALLSR